MKIKIGGRTGVRIDDLDVGDVFRFTTSNEEQVYQMSVDDEYQSLKTGVRYSTATCCPDARVIRYPNAVIDLGEPEGSPEAAVGEVTT